MLASADEVPPDADGGEARENDGRVVHVCCCYGEAAGRGVGVSLLGFVFGEGEEGVLRLT